MNISCRKLLNKRRLLDITEQKRVNSIKILEEMATVTSLTVGKWVKKEQY